MRHVANQRIGLAAAAAALLALAPACGNGVGGVADQLMHPQVLRLAAQRSADLDSENGMFMRALLDDALALTGEVLNGMPPSLLELNGISSWGVSSDAFAAWFAADPVTANVVMRYLTRCALPASGSLSYTYADVTYTWTGALGLAPVWAADYPIPEIEQQLVSACLAAHANKYGMKVPISVLGRRGNDETIPVGDQELADYPLTEGCFFGNVFQAQGVFSGDDRAAPLTDQESSSRACAMADRSGAILAASSECPPIVFAGSCRDMCQPSADGLYYESCTVNGIPYRALSTRIKPTSQYTCGDGICDISESCGTGTTWNSCSLDCGPCF